MPAPRRDRPPWWRLTILPRWFAHALMMFGLLALVAYPMSLAGVPSDRWSFFVLVIVVSLVYGIWASRIITQTITASDEDGYTVRYERRRKTKQA
jgi:hypothetical protein